MRFDYQKFQTELEYAINATPTGHLRNKMTELNILLEMGISNNKVNRQGVPDAVDKVIREGLDVAHAVEHMI